MRGLRAWLLRLAGLAGKARRDRELAAEIESHLQLHIDDNLRSGMTPEEARRDAMLRFGPVEAIKESYRDRRGIPALEELAQDVRSSARSLRNRPLFTAIAVLTLGLAIGATTAMFSVVDGVLLTPLRYQEPDRLVTIWQTAPDLRGIPGDDGARWDRYRLTYLQYLELSRQSTLYESLAVYRAGAADVAVLTGVGEPLELRAGAATESLLTLLGVRPALGRWFLPGEVASTADAPGAVVAVISYGLWRGRFDGDPEVLGRVVTLDDRAFTIVGVLPPGFRIQWLSASVAGEGVPGERDLWFPVGAPGWNAAPQGYSWEAIGRLTPAATVERARAETKAIVSRHPDTHGEARVLERSAEETRGLAPPLVFLFGATALLLLIACANIATLSTAEIWTRRHEIATRSALGASKPRIARLFLTESFVLAVLGSIMGALFAFGGTGILVAMAPPIPRLHEVVVDSRVLGFAALAGAFAALLFGAAPSLLAARSAVATLRTSAATSTGRSRLVTSAVAVEVAMAVVLLVAAGLLTRSYSRLMAVDPGFDSDGLATVEVRLPGVRYPTRDSRAAFFRAAIEQLEEVPGIGTVSAVSRLPFPGHTSGWGMRIEEREEFVSPLGYQVRPGYLATLGVPLLAGRALAESDDVGAPLAVVINQTMARRFWPDASPIGARISWSGSAEPLTVVGIVGDMKRQVLYEDPEPAFFIPFRQHPDESICFIARTDMAPRELTALMRQAVASLDKDLVVKNEATVATLVAASAAHERFRTVLISAFGFLAALLATAGVFGVAARSVALRTHEIGVKMALGARSSRLIGAAVRSVLVAAVTGTAAGVAAAFWTSRLLARFLYEVEPSDLTTFGVVTAATVFLCLLAAYLPARRITKVSPADVLKAN